MNKLSGTPFTVRLNSERRKKLDALAKFENRTVAEIINSAVDDLLIKNKNLLELPSANVTGFSEISSLLIGKIIDSIGSDEVVKALEALHEDHLVILKNQEHLLPQHGRPLSLVGE